MSFRIVLRVIGLLLVVNGLAMASSVAVSWIMGDTAQVMLQLTNATLITFFTGVVATVLTRSRKHSHIGFREGFAVVTLGWVFSSVFGGLPYMMVSDFSFADAFFETISGYTTTGASIMTDIEAQPYGLLFWRAMTHWLGGMGIVVLSLAILPVLGIGGQQLFKAEVPGPISDQLTPKIADSAKILWLVYVLLTVVETVLLKFAGMTWYDAVCHSFATMATGGFSTKNASVRHYHTAEFSNGLYIDIILIVFMFLAGCNFVLHFFALKGKPLCYFKDEEFKFYLKIVLLAIIGIAVMLYFYGSGDPAHPYTTGYAIQNSAFTTVSIITTTGFCTGNFDVWPQFARVILLGLMFVGGCGGSTGGGIKVSRIQLLYRYAIVQLKRCFYPHMVSNVRLSGLKVDSPVIHRTLSFFYIFLAIFFLVALSLTIFEPAIDFETALSSSAATLGNIGPGLAKVGAWENYSHFKPITKYILSFAMLVGRLEIYTVMVLFVPSFWKR